MNTQPITAARDADLRHSLAALQRAAHRARELAAQSGTAIVVSRQGVLETIRPSATPAAQALVVQEPTGPYEGGT